MLPWPVWPCATTQTAQALAPPSVVTLLRDGASATASLPPPPAVWASGGALTASTGLTMASTAPPMTVSIRPHTKSSTLSASSMIEHNQEQGQMSQHHQKKQNLKHQFRSHGQLRRKVHGRAERVERGCWVGSGAPSQLYGAASLGRARVLPLLPPPNLRLPNLSCPPHTRDRVNHCLGTVKDGVEDVCEGLHGGKGHVVHAANDLHKDLRMEEGWLRSVLANAYPPGHMHVLK